MLQITRGRDAPARYGAKCSRGRKSHTSRRRNNPRPTRGEMLQRSAARLFDPYPGPPPLPRLVPLSCSAPSSCLPISFAPAFSPLLPHPHQLLFCVATYLSSCIDFLVCFMISLSLSHSLSIFLSLRPSSPCIPHRRAQIIF